VIGALLRVEVPDPDGGDRWALFEVDLHPLQAVEQFDEVALAGFLVAIGDEVEVADDRGVVAAGDGLALESSTVPSGTRNSGALVGAWTRLGTFIGLGVPSMSSGGSSVVSGTPPGAGAAGAVVVSAPESAAESVFLPQFVRAMAEAHEDGGND
jgi:hypothetical protein